MTDDTPASKCRTAGQQHPSPTDRTKSDNNDRIAAQPDDPWLLNDHAAALQRASQPDDALPAYDRALVLDPDNPSPHVNRASLLFGLARFEEAQDDLLAVARPVPRSAASRAGPAPAVLRRGISLKPGP